MDATNMDAASRTGMMIGAIALVIGSLALLAGARIFGGIGLIFFINGIGLLATNGGGKTILGGQ